VLDDIERRRFLVQPAREDALPRLVGPLNVDLDERAGELVLLPRRGGFAGPQMHGDVFPPRRLTGMEGDILDDAVALVENGEHRNALGHRRDTGLVRARSRAVAGARPRRILLGAAAARGQRERDHQRRCDPRHVYSGIHGS
jgi:hypothetical protein